MDLYFIKQTTNQNLPKKNLHNAVQYNVLAKTGVS